MPPTSDAGTPQVGCNVAVVGCGVAGLSAAIAAAEEGATAVLLEKAPRSERGGNTRFSDAQIRFPHEADRYCKQSYNADEFLDDLVRLSRGEASRELVELLASQAADAVEWLTGLGVRWEEGFPHTAGYRRRVEGGGQGLVDTLCSRLEELGVAVHYETPVQELLVDDQRRVHGVRARSPAGLIEIKARSTVLASGGFQADPAMRVEHLGPSAASLVLRGSRHDTGDGLRMALAVGAQPAGQWTDYHAAIIDARSAQMECGVTALYNYQMGIIVNAQGQRFLDEGEDFRDHTYVKFAKVIVEEASGLAFCIFDDQAFSRPEFQRGWRLPADPIVRGSLEELATALGIPPAELVETVRRFNAAVQPGRLDLDLLDGKGAAGISPPKSNWALPIEVAPFVGVPVKGGITFTFGGLKVGPDTRVIDDAGAVIKGLFAAGEIAGEFFYYNYPGATSVLRGAVFGRIAGRNAARAQPRV